VIAHALSQRALSSLHRQGEKPLFPGLVGAFSFLATFTQTVPVEWLVVSATLANPKRWLAVALLAATASGLAAVGLYFAFHHFGWALLAERYPDLTTSQAWVQATDWLSRHGTLALFALMALPLPVPKLPALAFAGMYQLPVADVILAIWAGKGLKYSGYAYVAACFPAAIRHLTALNGSHHFERERRSNASFSATST
jgi:membrane protein YqaA with SNARE-associated domain